MSMQGIRSMERILLAMVIIAVVGIISHLSADDCSYASDEPVTLTEDMIYWEPNSDGENTCTITGYTENLTANNIVIPEKLTSSNGVEYTITQLDGAFISNKNIVKVELPETLRLIGPKSFYFCLALEEVIYNSQVCPDIGDGAFQYTKSLKRVVNCDYSGQDVVCLDGASIGRVAFDSSGVTKVSANNCSFGTNAYGAFGACKLLKNISLSGMEEIPGLTFRGCTSLSSITIPDTVRTIKYDAFDGCDTLKYVNMSKSIENISNSAFANCPELYLAVVTPAKKTVRIGDECQVEVKYWAWGTASSNAETDASLHWISTSSTVASVTSNVGNLADVTGLKAGFSTIQVRVVVTDPNNEEKVTYAKMQITVLQNHTVSYNANGGSLAPSSQTKINGIDLILHTNKPHWSGHTFLGWATSPEGDVQYNPGDIYTEDEHLNLYAIWSDCTDHVYDGGSVTKDPTCMSDGAKKFTCLNCGETYTESIPAIGHNWNNGEVTEEATCDENGIMTYTCINDSTHKRTEVIPAIGHDYETSISAIPTCTDAGLCAFSCRNCGDTYIESIPATGHDWNSGKVTKEPTCEEKGEKTYACLNDLSHTRTETIPAVGHSWSSPEYTWNEDNTRVKAVRVCDNNSEHIQEEIVPVTQTIIRAASCKEGGTRKYTSAEFQNPSFVIQEKTLEDIEALGHMMNYVPPKMPTCESHGHEGYWSCTRCESMFSDDAGLVTISSVTTIPATGHDYDDGAVTKNPTCTLNGLKTFTCRNCGDAYTESIPATGHDWNSGKVTKEATCDENGIRTYTCKNDSTHTRTEVIPATDHDYNEGEITSAPTCMLNGVMTFTCRNCGDTYTESIPATGHDWNSGKVTKEPTCEEKGEKKYKCKNDSSHEKTEVIPSINHRLQEVARIEPTCTDSGVEAYWVCAFCNRLFSDEEGKDVIDKPITIQPKDHDWGEWTTIKEPTEVDKGEEKRICMLCGEEVKRDIPVLSHIHSLTRVPQNPATCLSNGNKEYWICDAGDNPCNRLFLDKNGETETSKEEVVLQMHGHNWLSWRMFDDSQHMRTCEFDSSHREMEPHSWDSGKVIKEATATSTGIKTFTCTICAATRNESIPKNPNSAVDSGSDKNKQKEVILDDKGVDGTALGKGASAAVAESAITTMKNDADPAGSEYSKLQLKSTKQTRTTIKLEWKKVSGAKRYVVYGNECGKTKKMKKLFTTRKNKVNVRKISKILRKGKYHKFIVVALDKNNRVISSSKLIHVATSGGKSGNHKRITLKANVGGKAKVVTKVSVRKGKRLKLKATLIPKSKKLRVVSHVVIRYESSNEKVADVSKNGVIRGKKKGSARIYVYAQNGISKVVKITVK